MSTLPYLRWPLRVGSDGTFVTAASPSDVWADRMRGLVSTRVGERVMRETYGCGIGEALFQEIAVQEPESMVREAVSKWLPEITVDRVYTDHYEGVFDVDVDYTLPNGSEGRASLEVGDE